MEQSERRERRDQARRATERQCRTALASAGAAGALLLAIVFGLSSLSGGVKRGDRAAGEEAPPPSELPRGGRSIFPEFRVVGFYGSPQEEELGVLGIGSPASMARKLESQARPYAEGRGGPADPSGL